MDPRFRLRSVKRIWDAGEHNAFPELVHYGGQWICAFREASKHMSFDGVVRVLISKDGESWSHAATLTHPEGDLREVRASVTPDGQLLFHGCLNFADSKRYQSLVWSSNDGMHWSDGQPIGEPQYWNWRVRWRGDMAYSVAYHTWTEDGEKRLQGARLMRSPDGLTWETWVPDLLQEYGPNEADLAFLPDHSAIGLFRRDDEEVTTTLMGRADRPYSDWTFTDCGIPFHCPNILPLPTGEWLAGGRLWDPLRTGLCLLNPEVGSLTEVLSLPSDGDTGYPGMVLKNDQLWIAYYSSHEEKTSIYLAQVSIDGLTAPH